MFTKIVQIKINRWTYICNSNYFKPNILLYSQTRGFIFDYKSSCFENEQHQTRVSLLLELVSDAYITANRTEDLKSSTQVTIPLDHRTRTMNGLKAAVSISRIRFAVR